LTFSLTELGMVRHWILERNNEPGWKKLLAIHGTGLVMCVGILIITVFEKFAHGGWVTAVIRTTVVGICFLIRAHYNHVREGFKILDEVLGETKLPEIKDGTTSLNKSEWTAVLPVASFSGFGIHHVLFLNKLFPNHFKNIVFVSVGVLNSGSFKG